MKKIFFAVLAAIAITSQVSLTSCTTMNRTASIAKNVHSEVLINPIGAELDIEHLEKISGQGQAWHILGIRMWGDKKFLEYSQAKGLLALFKGRTSKVQAAALYKAAEGKDIDAILSPKYETAMKSYVFGLLRRYRVNVSAYGAKIDDFYHYDKVKDPQWEVKNNRLELNTSDIHFHEAQ